MHLRDMKYIGFKHQRDNKQNSDNECLMPFLTIFQLYHSGQCYWYRSSEYHKKTTDLLQATNTRNSIVTGHFALKPCINQKFCFETMHKSEVLL
jgi:hypothetical protein